MAYRATTSPRLMAARVRRLRRKLLLTQGELAAQFGVQALEVWRWEHGERVPRLAHQRTLYALECQTGIRKEGG